MGFQANERRCLEAGKRWARLAQARAASRPGKDGHYMMIKGSIQEEDITIINIYAPNIGAPQYVRQVLTSMKGEINNNTIIV